MTDTFGPNPAYTLTDQGDGSYQFVPKAGRSSITDNGDGTDTIEIWGETPNPSPFVDPRAGTPAYLFVDQRSRDVLAELPLSGVTLSQRLNAAGSLSGTLDLADPRVRQVVDTSALDCGRTEIYVVLNGVIVWAGIEWTGSYQATQRQHTVGATELWSYFSQRVQAKDYSTTWTTATDPMVIAQTMIEDAIAVSDSALSDMTVVRHGTTNPAYGIAPSYPSSMVQTIDMVINMLSRMGPGAGFDYDVSCALQADGTIDRTCNLWNPRSGRTTSSNGLVVDTRDATDYTYPVDATQQGTTVWVRGAGGASSQISESNTSPLTAGWPVLEQVVSVMNISWDVALDAIAKGEVATVAMPVATPTITLPLDAFPLGSFTIGDDVRWIHEGDFRFPDGFDEEWRIVGSDVTIADSGLSTVMLTLAIPPVFG